MRFGLLNDMHIVRRQDRLHAALRTLRGAEMLLMAGDLADRGLPEQYALLQDAIRIQLGEIPVFCVCGNHDASAWENGAFHRFARSLNRALCMDDSGAFWHLAEPDTDLIGLNPAYHQKQFYFPERGRQLAFLEAALAASPARRHIVLCHPPLMAHNPQRSMGDAPYIIREQNDRLQSIVERYANVIFLSGHTHLAPTVEAADRGRLYINNGSICPTVRPDRTQQGNAALLETGEDAVSLRIVGIHTGIVFHQGEYSLW